MFGNKDYQFYNYALGLSYSGSLKPGLYDNLNLYIRRSFTEYQITRTVYNGLDLLASVGGLANTLRFIGLILLQRY